MDDVISLAHGSGGEASRRLIDRIVSTYFPNDVLGALDDSGVVRFAGTRIALTTDSYVVSPVFFPGGDIGSLAVNGTVNDLCMVGAVPMAVTLGLILEEGFPVAHLDKVLDSVRRASKQAGVLIAAGDTKVVGRGSADGIFINTSGIGSIPAGIDISSSNARPGDVVILSGTIGDHGIAVLSRREGMDFETEILSDTAPLNAMVEAMLRVTDAIHTMRDPTRGGLATTLNEIARKSSVGISVDESAVPIRDDVLEACEMLGFDPFYVANEGKLVAFVPEAEADAVLLAMQEAPYGERSAVIGRVLEGSQGTVVLNTAVGGKRVLAPLSGELLPRIC